MLVLIGVMIAVVVIIIGYFQWSHQYWRRKNLPYLEPRFPFGNMSNPLKSKENLGITVLKIYNKMRQNNWNHGGVFVLSRPVYIAIHLDYIRNILTKDFNHFVDRGFYQNEKDDPLSAHLFSIGGTKWKNLRMKLTPTFTSGKMKMMFQTLLDCESGLQNQIEKEIAKNEAIDIKEVLACFTTNVIGSCAFGLDLNTFSEEDSPFRKYGKKIMTVSGPNTLKRLIGLVFPNFARALSITLTSKDAEKFFTKVVTDMVDYREKNNVRRTDFMQLLIDLKNNKLAAEDGYKHDGNTLTIEEIAAQSALFFVAGFETSSTTMTFVLYELAKHQEIQQKVRDEIGMVLERYKEQITYEAIQEMKYMDQVIDETLRKYPPGAFVTRQCIQDYKIPNENITIEKGTTVVIPILGLHHDKEYFPDPDRFDPERFSEENKSSRNRYAFIPFGEGPRMCIAMRFGLMQSKVGLTSLLKSYNFTVNQKTQEPLRMKPDWFVLTAVGEIWLDAQRVKFDTR